MTSFSPAITFATPGDLSVSYSQQVGNFVEVNNIVFFNIFLGFTPTFTTASGQLRITNLPETAVNGEFTLPISLAQSFNFPANTTMLSAITIAGQSYATVVASGSGVAAANLTTTELTSSGNYFLTLSGFYLF